VVQPLSRIENNKASNARPVGDRNPSMSAPSGCFFDDRLGNVDRCAGHIVRIGVAFLVEMRKGNEN
jgi:hypothetical protein